MGVRAVETITASLISRYRTVDEVVSENGGCQLKWGLSVIYVDGKSGVDAAAIGGIALNLKAMS